MGKIIEASELPHDDKVYMKKDFLGWKVVQPVKIDGKINWFNFIFGGKRGLFFAIIVLVMAGLFYIGVGELVSTYEMIANNPCDFCDLVPTADSILNCKS